MTGKRMRKLLMAAGVQRNVANKISHACGKNVDHADVLWGVLLVPGLLEKIEEAERYGVKVIVDFGDTNGKPWMVKET